MCTTVITPDGRWLTSLADLFEEGWDVQRRDVTPELRDEVLRADYRDFCLCGVNVQAILLRSGETFTDDGSGFLEITS